MDIIKRVLTYVKPYIGYAVLAILMVFVLIAANLVLPYLTKLFIDNVLGQGERNLLPTIIICIVGLSLIKGVAIFMRSYNFEKLSQSCAYKLKTDMYRHLQELNFAFFDKNATGELMSRMTGDLDGIRNFLSSAIPTVVENFAYLVGSAIILFSMDKRLGFFALIPLPVVAVLAVKFDKKVRPAHTSIREQQAVLNRVTQENIAGIHIVKSYSREDFEIEKFAKENNENKRRSVRASMIGGTFFPIMDFFTALGTIFVVFFGGRYVINGEISCGTLVAFNSYLWMLVNPMRMLGWIINMMEQTYTSGKRVFDVLDTGSNIREKDDAYDAAVEGTVEFDHVGFAYADREILHDINLTAVPGKTVAIMGETGSGKSSIINLIPRFYDVTSGAVKVDGVDVRDWKMSALRSGIGLVMQDTFLFSDSVEENIRFGRTEATHEEIVEAARIAGAEEFINKLPDGYETVVGERGMGLSGGQKQRLSIARALVRNPRILIMDDCTSAVDMETEHEILKALRTKLAGKAVFIIAHRISSVKDADEIIILEQGKIVERGNHDELMALKGRYYTLFMQQCGSLVSNEGGEEA